MTTVGANRLAYSKTIEAAPSRFTGTDSYSEWAERADAWAADGKPERTLAQAIPFWDDWVGYPTVDED